MDLRSDQLVPACGGTELPFVVNGRRWLYCYHPASERHAYLDLDNDCVVWNRQFHPAWSPEYEFVPEEMFMTTRQSAHTVRAASSGYDW